MRSWLAIVLLVSIACCTMACSTKNISTIPSGSSAVSGSFTVVTEPGTGTFVPALTVDQSTAGTVVTISAQNAQGLAAAYLHLQYDAKQYSPESVEVSSFLGAAEEVLSLSLTDVAGDVPVGVAQISSTGVAPRSGDGVLAVVHFNNAPFMATRSVSSAPAGTRNKVSDLAITGQSNSQVTFTWTEKNIGDYNNNGTIGITDLTPLAVLFGQTVATAADPVWVAMVDGSGDGQISLADMTPIGQNYNDRCDGYILYTNAASTTKYNDSGIHALRSAITPINPKVPVVYHFTANYTAGDAPEYSVRPALSTDISHPGPDSNHVNLLNEVPGAPDAPSGLTATASQEIGEYTVHLSWIASGSEDVVTYEVYRKTTSGAAWAKVGDYPVTVTACNNVDNTMTAQSYDYRVLAKDFTGLSSDYSNVASATPYVPPTLDPPLNAVAEPSKGAAYAIDVTWQKPANNYGTGFRVYCKGPGQADFTVVAANIAFDESPLKYTHTGLTEGSTYVYYVKTLKGSSESASSNTVTAEPSSSALPIHIQSITTNKTTHLSGGTETPANITVTLTPSAPDTVLWTGPGVFSNTGDLNPTWKPNGSTKKGKVTLSVTVTLGANNDTGTIDMYVTGEPIVKTFTGRDGVNRQIGNPAGSGIFTDVALSVTEYLQPLSEGGAITPGTGQLLDVTTGHTVLFNEWELWCGPCKAEFPELDTFAEEYAGDGFLFIANSSETGAGYGINDIKAWFTSSDIDYCNEYHGNIYSATWAKLGADGYIPFNVFVDRDGMVRKIGGAATGADWETVIKECSGAI